MKKILAILLAALMALTLVACGDPTPNPSENPGNQEVEVPWKSAEELANMIWEKVPEDSKFAGGGASIDLSSEDGKFTVTDLGLAEGDIAKIDDAAQFRHMMNQNTFSAGIYHFKNASDIDGAVKAMKENIMGKMWMCGFPEKVVIITLPGNYVISMFGHAGLDAGFTMDCIGPFVDGANAIIDGVKVVVDELL